MTNKQAKQMVCSIVLNMPKEVTEENSNIFSVRVIHEAKWRLCHRNMITIFRMSKDNKRVLGTKSVTTIADMIEALEIRIMRLSDVAHWKSVFKDKSPMEADYLKRRHQQEYRATSKFLKLVQRDISSYVDDTIKQFTTPSTKKSKSITKTKGGKTK